MEPGQVHVPEGTVHSQVLTAECGLDPRPHPAPALGPVTANIFVLGDGALGA